MRRTIDRLGWLLAGVLAVFVVSSAAELVSGGPLDPGGGVSPTLRSIGDLPPAWDELLSANGGCSSFRFKCVLNNSAALDRETGLVWERSPSTLTLDWFSTADHCLFRGFGSRRGGRVPTQQELVTLFDNTASNPSLPEGHPFSNFEGTFWTSDASPVDADNGRAVDFFNGFLIIEHEKIQGDVVRAWCVRAPE